MKLQIYDKTTCVNVERETPQVRSVNINKNGSFRFTKFFCEEMGMDETKHILFACDEDSKNREWYLSISHLDTAYKVYKKNADSKTPSFYVAAKTVANKILNDVKAANSASILIAIKPTVIDGAEWYKMVTSKPLFTK